MSRSFVAALMASILVVSEAQAAGLYSGPPTQDTYTNYGATNNFGASTQFNFGSFSGQPNDRYTTFLGWNDLPSDFIGSTVDSATLTLKVRYASDDNIANGPFTFGVQLLTQSWAQGTGNNNSPGDGVTTSTYNGVNAWPGGAINAGNDLVKDASSTIINFATVSVPDMPYNNENIVGSIVFDMKSALQYWADGHPNDGIRIVQLSPVPSPGDSIVNMWSGDEPNVSKQPVLEVHYTPAPEPTSVALLVLGAMLLVVAKRRVR